MSNKNKNREREIVEILTNNNGLATTREIANQMGGANVNGVAQTLGRMDNVVHISGKRGESKWQLKND